MKKIKQILAMTKVCVLTNLLRLRFVETQTSVVKNGGTTLSRATITILIFSLTFYYFFQSVYSYHLLDKKFDAHQYLSIYDYFRGNTAFFNVRFPFNSRILSSCLAAQMPFDSAVQNFRMLNLIAQFFAVLLLIKFWQKLHIRSELIFVAVFFVVFHWKGLVRMYAPDPATSDVMGYLFITLWLILWHNFKGKYWQILAAILLSIVGVLQKEVFLCVMLLNPNLFPSREGSFFSRLLSPSLRGKGLGVGLLCLIIAIITYYLTKNYFTPTPQHWHNNPIITLLRGIKRYFLNPNLLLNVPISLLLAYGGFLIYDLLLAICDWRKFKITNLLPSSVKTMSNVQYPTFIIYLLTLFAGGDTARIAYNFMPLLLTIFLLKLNQRPSWVVWFIFVANLPLMRLFSFEPNLGLFPEKQYDWCVECWTWSSLWPYYLYIGILLVVYHYLSRRFGAV